MDFFLGSRAQAYTERWESDLVLHCLVLLRDRSTEGTGLGAPARNGVQGSMLGQTLPNSGHNRKQQKGEDLDSAKNPKQEGRLYGARPGGHFQPQGQIYLALSKNRNRSKAIYHNYCPGPVECPAAALL